MWSANLATWAALLFIRSQSYTAYSNQCIIFNSYTRISTFFVFVGTPNISRIYSAIQLQQSVESMNEMRWIGMCFYWYIPPSDPLAFLSNSYIVLIVIWFQVLFHFSRASPVFIYHRISSVFPVELPMWSAGAATHAHSFTDESQLQLYSICSPLFRRCWSQVSDISVVHVDSRSVHVLRVRLCACSGGGRVSGGAHVAHESGANRGRASQSRRRRARQLELEVEAAQGSTQRRRRVGREHVVARGPGRAAARASRGRPRARAPPALLPEPPAGRSPTGQTRMCAINALFLVRIPTVQYNKLLITAFPYALLTALFFFSVSLSFSFITWCIASTGCSVQYSGVFVSLRRATYCSLVPNETRRSLSS